MGEMTGSRTRQDIDKMSLEHLIVPERKEVLKYHRHEDMSEGHRGHPGNSQWPKMKKCEPKN